MEEERFIRLLLAAAQAGYGAHVLRAASINSTVRTDAQLWQYLVGLHVSAGFKCTPLFLTTINGTPQRLRWLLDTGCNPNQSLLLGAKALHWAATSGEHWQAAVLTLIQGGADVNAQDASGIMPLEYALCARNEDMCIFLIEHGAQVNFRTSSSLFAQPRNTPLAFAISHELPRPGLVLAQHVADVAQATLDGPPPLLLACEKSMESVARALVVAGADIHAQGTGRPGGDKQTALMWACRRGWVPLALMLLERGADIHVRDNFDRTALHHACGGGAEELVLALIRRGADVHLVSTRGETPLVMACSRGMEKAGMEILERSAVVHGQAGIGALKGACEAGSLRLVTELLSRGTDVNTQWVHTPLHAAAQEGHTDIVRLLLEKGARVDAGDGEGRTPLHLASSGQHWAACALLTAHGASDTTRDARGRLPARNGAILVYMAIEVVKRVCVLLWLFCLVIISGVRLLGGMLADRVRDARDAYHDQGLAAAWGACCCGCRGR